MPKLALFGNDWLLWATAAAISIVSFAALRLIKALALRRLEAMAPSTETSLDDLAVELVRSTKFLTLFAAAVYMGSLPLQLVDRMATLFGQGLVLVFLIQAAIWGNKAIGFWLERYMKRRATEDLAVATSIGLISFLAKILLYSTIFLLALSNLGINITALVAGLGVGGIAVALAAQNILGDLFASLSIVLDKPFIVGDFIIVGDFLGTIEHIGIKTTRIRSLSGEQLIFSNADLLQSRIRNYKRMHERRVVFTLKLVHQTPVEKLQLVPGIIKKAVEKESLTRFDRSHFSGVGDFSLNVETVYWVKSPDYNVYMDIHQRIHLQILEEFRKNEIEFAYPTQNLFLGQRRSFSVSSVGDSTEERSQFSTN